MPCLSAEAEDIRQALARIRPSDTHLEIVVKQYALQAGFQASLVPGEIASSWEITKPDACLRAHAGHKARQRSSKGGKTRSGRAGKVGRWVGHRATVIRLDGTAPKHFARPRAVVAGVGGAERAHDTHAMLPFRGKCTAHVGPLFFDLLFGAQRSTMTGRRLGPAQLGARVASRHQYPTPRPQGESAAASEFAVVAAQPKRGVGGFRVFVVRRAWQLTTCWDEDGRECPPPKGAIAASHFSAKEGHEGVFDRASAKAVEWLGASSEASVYYDMADAPANRRASTPARSTPRIVGAWHSDEAFETRSRA